ncbi:translation initiation factor IF-2 [Kwoniella pini CBS 10737]|uniref:Translation initiation factor IF-2, mitochondrial n=1 Tax=Kwoniella pini CBS 10737 TaxID=1296096 RepID=A0A1B9I679_9TREE|nr:translation initiation factor IF-2 [Kwoniella pini CBS 10737]OCF51039.1 translation initiation factor IF-2 [Kwoniella pini CBS 10737]
MATTITHCRCCRGILYHLPSSSSSSKRQFASTAYNFAEKNEGFKLPSRDWSVKPSPSSRSNDGAFKRGPREDGRPKRKGNRPNEGRDSNSGGGPSNFRKPFGGRNDRAGESSNKWGVSRESARDSGITLGSGFGLKSAKVKAEGSEENDSNSGLRDLIEKSRKTNRIQRLPQQKNRGSAAFGDLLGSTSDGQPFKENPIDISPIGEKGEVSIEGGSTIVEEGDTSEYGKRQHGQRDRRSSHNRREGGSLLSRLSEAEELALPSRPHHNHKRNPHPLQPSSTQDQIQRKPKFIKPKVVQQEKQVYIPRTISVANLAKIFGVKLFHLQTRMSRLDMSEDQRRSDYLLNAEQACDIAIEYGFDPIVDDEASFDIYPDPDTADGKEHPLRPPVVTIMGHVDHGKTTLLDSLRHTTVAAGEAGGITQHIGAFSVPLSSLLPAGSVTNSSSPSTITFLDTPGHAAFTAMRARGASVTDIVVLVVAADDGVMPQTKEVLELVKSEGDKVGLVVAINKCDKPGVDFNKVKSALGAEGIHLEEDGGDIPSVKVSGLAKLGLDDLVETLSTLAEIRDLRARKEGKAEGYVLESRVDKGRGNVATVLITRGTLKTGSSIVAGQTWCRVRQMQDDKGKPIKEALPGQPISITGWKELPLAGDELLEAVKGEDEAKKAINNRKRDEERKRMMIDVEQINAKRKEERERLEAEAALNEAIESGNKINNSEEGIKKEEEKKILRLVIKADVSGTVEAVVGSLENIGNKEAGVKIVHTGVGEISESDVTLAEASDATIIGFNVKASRSIQTLTKSKQIPIEIESVIYRLIEKVKTKVINLLPPKIEYSVKGEAIIQQLFQINIKKKEFITIAGCRINNGIINKSDNENLIIKVFRGNKREDENLIYKGKIENLKHLKKDVLEVRKGMECGISLKDFNDLKQGDEIIMYNKIQVQREL